MNKKTARVRRIIIRLLLVAACVLITSGCGWYGEDDGEADVVSKAVESTKESSGGTEGTTMESSDGTEGTAMESPGGTGGTDMDSSGAAEGTQDTTERPSLPSYSYPGTDALYQTICDYIVDELAPDFTGRTSDEESTASGSVNQESTASEIPDATVCIPCPLIIDIDESNAEDICVSGEFWYHDYGLQGSELHTLSGGMVSGMIHMRKTAADDDTEYGSGYEVTGMDVVTDEPDGSQDHVSGEGSGGREGTIPGASGTAEEIFGDNYQAYLALNAFISIRENFRTRMLEDYLLLNHIPAVKYQDGEYMSVDLIPQNASLTSVEQLAIEDTDGSGRTFTFTYDGMSFEAQYTTENWKIIDSWKIQNAGDMEMICGALQDIHSIHVPDGDEARTPEDMMFEWVQHNFAYEHLPEDHPWREHAKDVDLNPDDCGKTFIEIYEDRVQDRFRIGDFLGDMTAFFDMLQDVDFDSLAQE